MSDEPRIATRWSLVDAYMRGYNDGAGAFEPRTDPQPQRNTSDIWEALPTAEAADSLARGLTDTKHGVRHHIAKAEEWLAFPHPDPGTVGLAQAHATLALALAIITTGDADWPDAARAATWHSGVSGFESPLPSSIPHPSAPRRGTHDPRLRGVSSRCGVADGPDPLPEGRVA